MPIIKELIKHKELARTAPITCSKCATVQRYIIARERTYITCLMIPCFLRSTRYTYACPACANSYPLGKRQVRVMKKHADQYGEKRP